MKPIIAEGWIAVTKKGQPMSKWRSKVNPSMIAGSFFPLVFSKAESAAGRGIPLKVRVTVEEVNP